MLALSLTADLTGVTDLTPIDTIDNPFYYTFKVQCSSCRETHDKLISISRFEFNDLSGSRGEANFVWKCRNCRRESSASIQGAPIPYTTSSPPNQQNILLFECRGCEFVEFRPEGDWECKGEEKGTAFRVSGDDLQVGEWYDYDEKAGQEVSIIDVKWEIRRA